MQWSDDAIVLSGRRLGEGGLVLELLTRAHGRAPGLIRGSIRLRGTLQAGNTVRAVWRARLAEHLGTYSCELVHNPTARWLDDPLRLAAIRAACALAEAALPEREPHPAVYEGLVGLLEILDTDLWPAVYVRWELELLRELGYGVDLSCCAATGDTQDLAYVSPRSAQSVSRRAGLAYHDRLLPLPGFLAGQAGMSWADAFAGLALTGYFLDRHVFSPAGRMVPPARDRLADAVRRRSAPAPSETPCGAPEPVHADDH